MYILYIVHSHDTIALRSEEQTWTDLPVLQTAEQDRHLTQTKMKIDTEVAGLKTMLESHKLDTIKYLAGRTSQRS